MSSYLQSDEKYSQIIQRAKKTINLDQDYKPQNTLHVLNWNTLCQRYTDGFHDETAKWVTWEHRFPYIQQQLTQDEYDIICLQEVDMNQDFTDFLGSKGYQGFIGMKIDGIMGCAIFWRASTVTAAQHCEKREFNGVNQIYVLGHFIHNQSGKHFMVVNTHLKAKKENRELRIKQANFLINDLATLNLPDEEFTILTGDFNDDPGEEPINIIKTKFTSSLEECFGDEKKHFTTFYFRESEGHVKRTIDYIFYHGKDKIRPIGYYDVPNDEDLDLKICWPHINQPSDHMALSTLFEIL
eukprot:403338838